MSGLPRGWVEIPLGELGEWRGGGTPSKANASFWSSGDIPWVSPKDMKQDIVSEAADYITEAAVAGSATQLVPAGSTLIVTRSGILRHTLPVATTTRAVAINQDLKALTPCQALDPFFASHQIRASEGAILSNCAKSGTTVDSIDFERLKKFSFWLPPLPEQRRIVAKIDSLTAKSRHARDHLDHIPRLVEKYKQAVLAAAFRGDLTREWRRLAGVSEAWRDVRWGDAGSTLNGRAFSSDDYVSQGIRLLRPGNLDKNGGVVWSDKNTRHLPLKYRALHSDHYIDGSEIVINLTAQSLDDQFLGRACLSSESDKFMLNQRLAVFRPFSMEKLYCLYALKSPEFRKFVDEGLNSGRLIQHIHTKNLMRYVFKVAPTVEQREIVRRIERAFTWIDRLADEATSARTLVDRLDQAVLAKAFRGELVPQDPADEPASVLLERIRAERAAAPKPKRGRRAAAKV